MIHIGRVGVTAKGGQVFATPAIDRYPGRKGLAANSCLGGSWIAASASQSPLFSLLRIGGPLHKKLVKICLRLSVSPLSILRIGRPTLPGLP